MHDQEEITAKVREKDLIAAVSGLRPDLNRVDALRTLLIRGSKKTNRVLRRTVSDRSAPDDVRSMAAVEMGRKANAKNEQALLKALGSKLSESVLRRTAQSLGRVGSVQAFAALQKIKTPAGSRAAASVAFAKTLLSYRHGMRKNLLPTPPSSEVLKFSRRGSVSLQFEPVKTRELNRSIKGLQETIPAIRITPRSAHKFCCINEELWLVINEEVVGAKARARAFSSNAVVAAVLRKTSCPEGWYVYEYLFSQPENEAGLKLFGVRPSGLATHYGSIRDGDNGALIKLSTLNTELALPIEFEATYDNETAGLDVKTAISAKKPGKTQKRPMSPRPLGLPQPDI